MFKNLSVGPPCQPLPSLLLHCGAQCLALAPWPLTAVSSPRSSSLRTPPSGQVKSPCCLALLLLFPPPFPDRGKPSFPRTVHRGADLVAVDSPPLEQPGTRRHCPHRRPDVLSLLVRRIEPGGLLPRACRRFSPASGRVAADHLIAGRPPLASSTLA